MGSVAINDWGISFFDSSWVVNNDNLSKELLDLFRRVIQDVTSNKSSLDLVGLQFNIESYVVSWVGQINLLVVHLDGFNLASEIPWSEGDIGFFLKNTSLNPSDSNGTMSLDFVNIVDWNSQWLLGWSFWGLKQVNGVN